MSTDAPVPLVSVIVPTFQSAATLPAALDSLAAQTFRDFEVVVSDGGSTDGTQAIARAAGPRLPALHMSSRPDRGVYDAINLALDTARGDWVLVLGSDDRLHAPQTLAQAAPRLREASADLVHGDVRVMNANRLGVPIGGRHAGPMPLNRLLRGNICQQAVFYRRSLFERIGRFDLSYPVMADWDFNLRAAFRTELQWIDLVVADYAADGMSARRQDRAAELGVPEMVRRELLARADEQALWPHHRVLLRQADVLRRQGQWRAAFVQLGSYLSLRLRRARHG